MSWNEPEDRALVDALRSDLPDHARKAELRERLIARGVIATAAAGVTAGVSASAAAAGSKTAAGTGGLLGKVAAALTSAKAITATVVLTSSLALPQLVQQGAREGSAESIASSRSVSAVSRARHRETRSAVEAHTVVPAATELGVPAPSQLGVATPVPSIDEPPSFVPERGMALEAPRVARRARTRLERERRTGQERSQAAVPASAAMLSSTLTAESVLLARAASALHARDLRSAEALLEQHAAQFSQGQLNEERELARRRLRTLQAAQPTRSR